MSTVVLVWTKLREIIDDRDRPFELRDLLCKYHEGGFAPSEEELSILDQAFKEGPSAILLYRSAYDPYKEK